MVKNHCLARSIHDASWGMFFGFLSYKAERKGKNVLPIGRFEPSSKRCHVCGQINQGLTLKDREWDCPGCSTHHDRDINAAKNIRAFALIKHYSQNAIAVKTQVRQEVPKLRRSGSLASIEADVELRSHTPCGCGTSLRPC